MFLFRLTHCCVIYSWDWVWAELMIEQSLLNVTYMVRSLDWKDPLEEGLATPLQYSCLENPREQKSLAGHSPHVSRELDTTEQLSTVHSMDHLHQIISCLIKTQILRPPPQSWISMSPGVAWKNKFLIRNFRWFLCPRKPKIHCCASLWESGWLIH